MSAVEHWPRTSIPILAKHEVSLPPAELDRLRAIADKRLRNEPALSATQAFGPLVRSGLSESPALVIGDLSEIPLYPNERAHIYEYRMGLLAQDGDVLALAHRNHPFEAYLRGIIGADNLDAVISRLGSREGEVRAKNLSLTQRCESEPAILSQLVALAAEQDGLNIIPYLVTGHQWRLASAIADASSVPIMVCGAPPRLSRRVNDKVWFAALARDVLGRTSIPPTFTVYGPAAAAGRALAIARSSAKVIVKVPSSAGSIGNIVLESNQLLDLRPDAARNLIVSLLETRGWQGEYPLLVGVWEAPVFTSPSVQTWIPLRGTESPIIDGIFEQRIRGERGSFVGAVPAQLPDACLERLASEGTQLAVVLQELGYFGRCSFDAVISGSDLDNAELHWIECNGRWGGVSLPMTLANRLTSGSHGGIVIMQASGMTVPSRSMPEISAVLGKALFADPGGREGVVVLSPTVFEMGNGLHFMAIAGTQARAETIADNAFQRLSE